MNCKPGDLAVIVRTDTSNARLTGAMVRCRYIPADLSRVCGLPVWHIEALSPILIAAGIEYAADASLRPIRDQPGTDETLTWAPVEAPSLAGLEHFGVRV